MGRLSASTQDSPGACLLVGQSDWGRYTGRLHGPSVCDILMVGGRRLPVGRLSGNCRL